jgi:hypothetical protein
MLSKHNKVRIKTDIKREEITKMPLDYFEEIKDKSTGMKGFMVMDDFKIYKNPLYLPSMKEEMIWIVLINQKTRSFLT